MVIEPDINIQPKFFVVNGFAQNDRVRDLDRNDVLFGKVEQGTDMAAQDFIPASNESSAVLARAFDECREGQYPAACCVTRLMPRQLAAG